MDLNSNIDEILDVGAISEEDLKAYLTCCLDALAVHLDRERARHGLWKDYPAIDQVRQIKIKTERILRTLERADDLALHPDSAEQQKMLEEYPDIINYAIFAWRIERELI